MSDQVDIHVALLRKFAEFTKKLSDDELVEVATGTLKIILDRPPQKAKTELPVDADDVGRTISQMSSRSDAAAYIDGLKLGAPQQKELARRLNVTLTGATSKAAVRDRIVEHVLGYRLNSEAIRAGAWADR